MAYDDKDWSGEIRSAVDNERYDRERKDRSLSNDISRQGDRIDTLRGELGGARSVINELTSTVADLSRRLTALEAAAQK